MGNAALPMPIGHLSLNICSEKTEQVRSDRFFPIRLLFFQLGSDLISKNFEAQNFLSDIQNLLECPSLIDTV
jgi:hypothetical protein